MCSKPATSPPHCVAPVLAGRTKAANIVLHLSNDQNDLLSFYLQCGQPRDIYVVAASRGVGTDSYPRRLAALQPCLLVEQRVFNYLMSKIQCSVCVHAMSSFKISMPPSLSLSEH